MEQRQTWSWTWRCIWGVQPQTGKEELRKLRWYLLRLCQRQCRYISVCNMLHMSVENLLSRCVIHFTPSCLASPLQGHSGPRHSHGHVRIHKGGWAGKEQVLIHLRVWPFQWFVFFARKVLQMIGVTCLGYRIAILKVLVSRALVACNLGSTSSLAVVWNGLTLRSLFLNGMHSLHRNWI